MGRGKKTAYRMMPRWATSVALVVVMSAAIGLFQVLSRSQSDMVPRKTPMDLGAIRGNRDIGNVPSPPESASNYSAGGAQVPPPAEAGSTVPTEVMSHGEAAADAESNRDTSVDVPAEQGSTASAHASTLTDTDTAAGSAPDAGTGTTTITTESHEAVQAAASAETRNAGTDRSPGNFRMARKLGVFQVKDAQYCIVPNACRSYDGQYIFEEWLEEHKRDLERCGFDVRRASFVDSLPSGGVRQETDLFGTGFLRYHFPHFMQDAFHTVTLFNIVFNPKADFITRFRCVQEDRNGCDLSSVLDTDWNPSVPLEDRVRKQDETSWVRSFLRLLPPLPNTGPSYTFAADIYPNGEDSAPSCFRSVIEGVPPSRLDAMPPSLTGEENIMFSKNRIAKRPREECPLNITVLDRVDQGSKTAGRYFVDTEGLKQSIEDEVAKRGLVASVQIIRFIDATFDEQIVQMNDLDFLITVHGAELTNIVWMRPKAKVIEVMPFLYDTEIFREMGSHLDVDVEQIFAAPDVERLEACLRFYNEKYDMEGSLQAVKEFSRLGDQYRATGVLGKFDPRAYDAKMLTACMRAQSLAVDPKMVARRVVSKLGYRCSM